MWIAVVIIIVIFAGAVLWQRIRSPRPAVPPLEIPDDEPRMLAAIAEARSSLTNFQEFARPNLSRARVRLPLITSSGATERLWAEVLRIDGDTLKIRLITPPVTHKGEFARVRQVPILDIDDWQIETDAGSYIGGFTMRAMFVIALEQWGSLPSELEQLRSKYPEELTGVA
jgi:uncharacterized protein YegJ (DUF2314 family)